MSETIAPERVAQAAKESPCTACGMCCDGTLYTRAKVAAGEEGTVSEKGLSLLTREGKTYFPLPCRFESCSRCTIYAERFKVCRTFECALLRRFNAGEIGHDEVLATILTAKELRAAVTAADPGDFTHAGRTKTRDRLAEQLSGLDSEDRARSARHLLAIVALDTFLERWFRNKKSEFK